MISDFQFSIRSSILSCSSSLGTFLIVLYGIRRLMFDVSIREKKEGRSGALSRCEQPHIIKSSYFSCLQRLKWMHTMFIAKALWNGQKQSTVANTKRNKKWHLKPNDREWKRNISNSIENQIMYFRFFSSSVVPMKLCERASARLLLYTGDNSLCRYENGFQFISSPFALTKWWKLDIVLREFISFTFFSLPLQLPLMWSNFWVILVGWLNVSNVNGQTTGGRVCDQWSWIYSLSQQQLNTFAPIPHACHSHL